MKRNTLNQSGFEHVTILVIVGLLVGVGIVGYRVANKPSVKTIQSKSTTTVVPETLKSKTDVTKAKNSLSAEQLEADLNPSQLDKDLSDLR